MEIKRESATQRFRRVAMNAWTQSVGLSAKAEKHVRIKGEERKLQQRKKVFGMQYMDLVQKDASDQQLQDCINQAKAELATIQHAIIEANIAVNQISENTRTKLKESPEKLRKAAKKAPLQQEPQYSAATGSVNAPEEIYHSEPEYVVLAPHVTPSAPREEDL